MVNTGEKATDGQRETARRKSRCCVAHAQPTVTCVTSLVPLVSGDGGGGVRAGAPAEGGGRTGPRGVDRYSRA